MVGHVSQLARSKPNPVNGYVVTNAYGASPPSPSRLWLPTAGTLDNTEGETLTLLNLIYNCRVPAFFERCEETLLDKWKHVVRTRR